MKKLALILGLHAALAGLWAQGTSSHVTVQSTVPGVRFYVDNVPYTTTASFFWAENSVHTVRVMVSDDGYQYPGGASQYANTRFAIEGWQNPSSPEDFDRGKVQTVYASPELTTIVLEAIIEYRQRVQFWDVEPAPMETLPGGCTGFDLGGPGVVYIDGTCYWRSTNYWSAAGEIDIQALPYSGWAFTGWIVNGGTPTTQLQTIVVSGPGTIYAKFVRAKRVKFITEPLGMKIMVDYSPTGTPRGDPCPSSNYLPRGLAPGSRPMCIGEYDWAPGTSHTIGVEPQRDAFGKTWVFESFSNGMDNHSTYEVTNTTPDKIVAKLVRGATVSFTTVPSGLSLLIDGHDNHRSYNFIRAPGTVIDVSAPAEQEDANGRKLVFKSWSNGGDREQQLEVPAGSADKGFRLTATYELLSQAVVVTDPAGVTVDVDGATCDTPCTIDRPDGTEVTVTVPENQVIGEVQRLHFEGWADGGPRSRVITISGSASAEYRANYSKRYLLRTSSSPADGAVLTMEPSSEDGYYTDGVSVQITAEANDGFSFRRWEGDLQGTHNVGTVKMSRPRTVIATLDEVPFAAPAVVMNAAGKTPKDIVAPGSMIAIYGVELAPHLHVGNASPLEQTLAGTTVRVADRVLALSYVSPSQINAVMHPDIPVGKHMAVISRSGELDVEGEVVVTRNAPGLFTYYLEPHFFIVAHHEDGTPVLPESPARRGEVISIFGTGFGEYNGIAPYGFALPESPEYLLVDTVEAFAGDLLIAPEFAGGSPGSSGMDVLKIKITEELPSASTVEFKIRINNEVSNTVLLPLE